MPKQTAAAVSAASEPARAVATSAAAIAGMPARTIVVAPSRRARCPPAQLPASVPAAMPKSATPSRPSVRCSACLIAGTRPAHVPTSTAWTPKAVPTLRPVWSRHGIAGGYRPTPGAGDRRRPGARPCYEDATLVSPAGRPPTAPTQVRLPPEPIR